MRKQASAGKATRPKAAGGSKTAPKAARKPGRPTKFTPETRAAMLGAIRLGATYEIAAQSAGIGYSTYREWVTRGEAGEAGFAEFAEDVKKAEGACAIRALEDIRAAGEETWQASAWILERRFRDSYGRTVVERAPEDAATEAAKVDALAQVAAALAKLAERKQVPA